MVLAGGRGGVGAGTEKCKGRTIKRHREIFWVMSCMFPVLIVMMVSQLQIYTRTYQTTHYKYKQFIVG